MPVLTGFSFVPGAWIMRAFLLCCCPTEPVYGSCKRPMATFWSVLSCTSSWVASYFRCKFICRNFNSVSLFCVFVIRSCCRLTSAIRHPRSRYLVSFCSDWARGVKSGVIGSIHFVTDTVDTAGCYVVPIFSTADSLP